MAGERWGRRGGAVCAAAVALTLTACSPVDVTAVGFDGGIPRIINCGGWIGGVRVLDAGTGQLIWAAERSTDPYGNGDIIVGTLPTEEWTELAPWTRSRPEVWRFEITKSDGGQTFVMLVDQDDVGRGEVMTVDGQTLTEADFAAERCGERPRPHPAVRVVLIALIVSIPVGGILALVVHLRRHRERMRQIAISRGMPPS